MDSKMQALLKQLRVSKTKHRKWQSFIQFCAAIVVFCTTYAMILPAITWDKMLICEKQEHIHSESCCEQTEDGDVLICELEEHTHDESCYDAPPAPEPVYLCGKEVHTHSELSGCFYPDGTVKCTMEEHEHSDTCLVPPPTEPVWLCGIDEHTHDEACYDENELLVCELTEHTHDEACLLPPAEEAVYLCGFEEHTHDEACYDENGLLICEYLEHTHDDLCLIPLEYRSFFSGFSLMALDESSVSVPSVITAAPQANEWQVVSGRYMGTTEETKVIKDADGNVLRLRKNVVPAGTENEFYIYITVEPVFYHDWVTIFHGSGMLVNNANNTRDYYNASFTKDENVNDIVKRLGVNSHSSLLVSDSRAPLTSNETTKTKFDIYIDTVRLEKPDGSFLVIDDTNLVFSLSQNSGSSFTIIYCAPNSDHCVKLSEIKWDGLGRGNKNDGGTLTFPAEAYNQLIGSNSEVFDHIIQRTYPQQVIDPMGEHIEFIEFVDYNSGSAEYKNGQIVWSLPNSQVEPSQNPLDYEQINTDDAFSRTGAYQMAYKVRLNVTDEGFSSAAAQMTATSGSTVNPTNGKTTVSYTTDKTPGETRNAEFPVPEVRGLLYDVSFRKLDQYSRGVPGAVFTLKNSAGDVIDSITTDPSTRVYTFSNLPCDTYTLEESIPEDYSAVSDKMVSFQSWTFTLCFTTDSAVLTPDTGQLVGNMVYNGGGIIPFEQGGLKITNYKFTREFLLKKIDPSGSALQGAQFKLYYDEALTEEVPANLLPSGDDGVFTPVNFTLPQGTYYLRETVVPSGYIAPSTVGVLTVESGGKGFRLFWNGKSYEATVDVIGYHTVYSAELVNNPSIPLPTTGGFGTLPITIAGILVLVITWSYSFMCIIRKGRWAEF